MAKKSQTSKQPELPLAKLTVRENELLQMLQTIRNQTAQDIEGRSTRRVWDAQPGDDIEHSLGKGSDQMDLEILALKQGLLLRVDEAIYRLNAGHYGFCGECGEEIAQNRLRALPFAVRCKTCEEKREWQELSSKGQPGSRLPVFTGLFIL